MILVRFKGWFGFVRRLFLHSTVQCNCWSNQGKNNLKGRDSWKFFELFLHQLSVVTVNSECVVKENNAEHPLLIMKNEQMTTVPRAYFMCMLAVGANSWWKWIFSMAWLPSLFENSDKHSFTNSASAYYGNFKGHLLS